MWGEDIMKSRFGTFGAVIFMCLFLGVYSCGGGGSGTDTGFKFSFDGVQDDDSVRAMELGACSEFNISYQGQLMTISGVALKDLNEVEFAGGLGGTVEYSGTLGTYCSPSVSPGKDVYIHVTIGTSPPAVAILIIDLPEGEASCTSSAQCQAISSDQFCYYGTCMTFESVGVDTNQPCDSDVECGEESDACIPHTYDSCQSYCTNTTTFFSNPLVPTSEEACNAVNGGWFLPDDDEGGTYICLTQDVIMCIAAEDNGSNEEQMPYTFSGIHVAEYEGSSFSYFIRSPEWPLYMDGMGSPCDRDIFAISITGGTQPASCRDHNGDPNCIGIGVGDIEAPMHVSSTGAGLFSEGATTAYITGRELFSALRAINANSGDIINFTYWYEFDAANMAISKTNYYHVQFFFTDLNMCDR